MDQPVVGVTGVVLGPNMGSEGPKLSSRALRVINQVLQVPNCYWGHLATDQPVIGVTGVV